MAFELYNWSEVSSSLNQGVITAAIATPSSDASTKQGSQNLFSYFSSTDTLATIEAANYFLEIAAYQLFVSDWILVTGTDGSTILQVTSITFTSTVSAPTGITTAVIIAGGSSGSSVQTGITAHVGGGQSGAYQLTADISQVTVVASPGNSVKLPLAEAGAQYVVINSGANAMQVFGAGTDTINGVATATGVSQLAGSVAVYYAITDAPAGNWESNLGYAVLPANSVDYPSLAKDVLQVVAVTGLTADQINGLYVTPQLILPAAGTGLLNVVVSVEYNLIYGSAAFTSGGTLELQYGSTTEAGGVICTSGVADTWLNDVTANAVAVDVGKACYAATDAGMVDVGIYLTSSATSTVGTGCSMNVLVRYYQIAVS